MAATISPRLQKVYIEGFRAIQEPLEIKLVAPDGQAFDTVVLAGVNGAGKTSVLEAILFGLHAEHLIRRRFRERGQRREQVQLPSSARIELDVSLDGSASWRLHRELGRSFIEQGGITRSYEMLPRPMAIGYFSSWRSPALSGPLRPLAPDSERPHKSETNRLWRLKQRIIDERARRGFQPTGGAMRRRDERWLERLNHAWRAFHTDDDTSIDVQIVDPNAEELYADLFIIKDGRRLCSVDDASSGELELLSFFGWMATNDFESGLMLIDEPELHLHPQWQSTIMPALKEFAPSAQFVIATHADAPWDQAFSFQRFLLQPHYRPPEPIAVDEHDESTEPAAE